jgi:hypothetical protein
MLKVYRQAPLRASQILTVLSPDPDASRVESGEKAIEQTHICGLEGLQARTPISFYIRLYPYPLWSISLEKLLYQTASRAEYVMELQQQQAGVQQAAVNRHT